MLDEASDGAIQPMPFIIGDLTLDNLHKKDSATSARRKPGAIAIPTFFALRYAVGLPHAG